MPFGQLLAAAKRVFASQKAPPRAPIEYPLEEEQRLFEVHSRAHVDRHLEILLGDYMIGNQRYLDVFRDAMRTTGTVVSPFNVFHRFETRRQLCRYLLETIHVPGLRAECGVYRGATALLLCRALRSRQKDYDGAGMFLIDSYSGTSRAVAQDLIPVRDSDGKTHMEEFFPQGKTDISADLVRGFFAREFPRATVQAGWIPEVLATLPESAWAYVHLDVTIYEPTLAALEYFYPRLSTGGVILCDGSIFCPGAEAAVRDYCKRNSLAYVLLGHRLYVIMKMA